MNNFVQQLPALVGVVLGALTTYLVTSASERSKWRKEQYIRWDERRIIAYADIADALKKVAWGFLRVAASNGLNVRVQSFQDEADQAQFLREVEIERSAKWEAVVLLGDKAVVSIAQQYSITIFKLGEIAMSSPINEDRWLVAVREMSRARWYFYNAIRNDLDIKSGDLEPDAMPSWIPIGLESSFNQSSDSVTRG